MGSSTGLTEVFENSLTKWLGFVAIIIASINIFGGFVVTWRMLAMFKKKQRENK